MRAVSHYKFFDGELKRGKGHAVLEVFWSAVRNNLDIFGGICTVLASAVYSREHNRDRLQVGIAWLPV